MADQDMAPGDEVQPTTPSAGETVCPQCEGTGKLGEGTCPECGGSGVVVEAVGGG
jgi:DnaJ-class molecular chaperone